MADIVCFALSALRFAILNLVFPKGTGRIEYPETITQSRKGFYFKSFDYPRANFLIHYTFYKFTLTSLQCK